MKLAQLIAKYLSADEPRKRAGFSSDFEERAAIMEFDGNMSRSEAEEMAMKNLAQGSTSRPNSDEPFNTADNEPTNGELFADFQTPELEAEEKYNLL